MDNLRIQASFKGVRFISLFLQNINDLGDIKLFRYRIRSYDLFRESAPYTNISQEISLATLVLYRPFSES